MNKFNVLVRKNFCLKRRVVITGVGMVSPLGINTNQSWANLKSYKSGIIDLSNETYGRDLPKNCKIGAPIPKDFDSKKYKTLVNKLTY